MSTPNYSDPETVSTHPVAQTPENASAEANATQRAAAEIRGLMGARKLNAVDLVPVLGISSTAVLRRYNGELVMNINEVEAIAKWLNVPITRIIAPASHHGFSK